LNLLLIFVNSARKKYPIKSGDYGIIFAAV
jgi:hypothetical protein